jgi:hypothetical protein
MKKLMLLGLVLGMFSTGSLKAEDNYSCMKNFCRKNIQNCRRSSKEKEVNERYTFKCWCPHKGHRSGCGKGCKR